ncbi:MAG TPA: ABC transporter permease [Dehalococcoidia bacterium]|nr:ABC transporter permease [Dehalococcoidia bacterium]
MSYLRTLRFGVLVGLQDFGGILDWRFWVITWGARVTAEATFYSLLGRLLDSPDLLRFLVIGNMIAVGSTSAFWATAFFTSDRWDGTYPMLVAAPSSILPPMVGRTSVWLVNGVASSLLAFVILGVVFDIAFPLKAALLAVPVVLLTIASAYSAALLLGGIMTPFPQAQSFVRTNVTTLITAFSGVSVPITFWPGSIETIAQVLPLTHGLRAIRALAEQGSTTLVLNEIGLQFLVGLGWLALALLLTDRIADHGRANGTIDLVEG